MKVVSPNQLVKTDTYWLKPFDRYVVSDHEFVTLTDRTPNTRWEFSSFNSYERRYGGQDLNGKNVCIYRHSAHGDQLIVSAVPRYLKSRFPRATVHLYCHPSVHSLWLNNPFVEGAPIPLPIPFDAMRKYDYHVMYEGMLEGNSEPDQNCCYDDMFNWIGCNPPDSFKRPFVQTRPEDYTLFNTMLPQKPYLVYHLSAANPNRTYPWAQGSQFLRMFHDAYPNWIVVIVGQSVSSTGSKIEVEGSTFPVYQMGAGPWVINLVDKTPDYRQLVPFIENADLVVCPDSSILHLAAAFPEGPKIVGLWGLFSSNDRARYYKNHQGVTSNACPHAPCRDHNFELPQDKCKDARQVRAGFCQTLAGISPETIMKVVLHQLEVR